MSLYALNGRCNLGHALETVVLLELLRQGTEVGYLRTSGSFEVDFHARFPDGRRALQQALQEPIGAATQARVISLDRHQPTGE